MPSAQTLWAKVGTVWFGTLIHFPSWGKKQTKVEKYYRIKVGMYIFLGHCSHVAAQTQSRQYSICITLGIGGFQGKAS